jgi:hypothetical protein
MDQQTNSIDNLLSIVSTLQQSGKHDLARWFAGGLDEYMLYDVPLEEALSLHGEAGKRKAKTRWAQEQRDSALRAAYHHAEGKNPTQKIAELRRQSRRFEGLSFNRYRHLTEPPESWSELRKNLFRAMKSGCPMPDSERQFYRIVMGW